MFDPNRPAYRLDELHRPKGPLGRTSLFRAIRTGRLKARKLGGSTLILNEDFREFLTSLPVAKDEVA